MSNFITLPVAAFSVAVFSMQTPATASTRFESTKALVDCKNVLAANSNSCNFYLSRNLVVLPKAFYTSKENSAQIPDLKPTQVAWSLGSAYRKAKTSVKKTGRAVGNDIRKGANWAHGKAKRGVENVRKTFPLKPAKSSKR